MEKYRAVGTTTRLKHSKASSNDWFEIFPDRRFPELLAEVFRVLKKNRHFYMFCNAETMFVVKPLAEAAGFKFWKPIVWDNCVGIGKVSSTDNQDYVNLAGWLGAKVRSSRLPPGGRWVGWRLGGFLWQGVRVRRSLRVRVK